MLRFFVTRLALIMVTLLVVSVAIFAIVAALPGDAAHAKLGQSATAKNLERLRAEIGLDKPHHERYLIWIGGVVRGDFGSSLITGEPLSKTLPRRIKHSVYLAVFALILGIPAAIIAGIYAGVRPNSLLDRVVSMVSLVGLSMPEFVTGVLLMYVLSSTFHLLPSASLILPGTSPLSRPEILIMPAMTLTGVLFAYIMRMTRANVMEVMETNYVRTAVLKGLATRRVIIRHVLPNAMLPTITIIAMNFGWMLGGLIIVENVFAYPGLGQLLLRSITTRDVVMLEALALIVAATYALSNLFADLAYAAIDPRIRLG
jgi:peptide/nickel transport system permease protein